MKLKILGAIAFVLLTSYHSLFYPIKFASQINEMKIEGHRVLALYDTHNSGLPSPPIYVIFEDRRGRMWISTFEGISLLDDRQFRWRTFSEKTGEPIERSIAMIAQSSDEKLWFAARPLDGIFGISRFNSYEENNWSRIETNASQLGGSRKDSRRISLFSMFQGQNGKVWFSILDGLVSFDGVKWSHYFDLSRKIKDSAPVTLFCGIQDSDGYVWMSGGMHGIIGFDESKSEWRTYDPVDLQLNKNMFLSNGKVDEVLAARAATIFNIYEDRQKRVWFASGSGYVYFYDKKKRLWGSYNLLEHFPSIGEELPVGPYLHIGAIYQDRAGKMFFATYQGLVIFDEEKSTWKLLTSKNNSLPSRGVKTILEDSRGRIWLGTDRGIVVLEP